MKRLSPLLLLVVLPLFLVVFAPHHRTVHAAGSTAEETCRTSGGNWDSAGTPPSCTPASNFTTDDKPKNPCETVPDSSLCKDYNKAIGDGEGNPIFGKTGILTVVARIFALATGVISVFMIIIGGLRYITSSGESSKTASAKNTIMYAAIGLAVALSGGAIVQFILTKL